MPKEEAGGRSDQDEAREEAGREAQSFVEGLIVRGEVVEASTADLPPGATHEIIGKDEQGRPKVRRRRFSNS